MPPDVLLAVWSLRILGVLALALLVDAVEEELIHANPAVGVKLPTRPGEATDPDELHFLSAAEVVTVESPAAGVPEHHRLLYTVAIRTGLRQGELWALRWGDVREADARPVVMVRASHANAPKNGKVQPVPLLPKAREAFARLRELARGPRGAGPKTDALVFPSPRGFRRRPSDDAGWSSRKVRGKPRVGHREILGVDPKVHFHGLRHTFASHLVMGTWGAPLPLTEAFEFATLASAYVLDYADRSGERRSVSYAGADVFRRAKNGLATLRDRRATSITVTATFATGDEAKTLADE